MAEMVTYLPISSPFIRFAGRYVDEAFGFAAGWNFFVFEAALVPFEVTACNVIINFWSDAVPTGAIIAIVIVLYALLNLLAVKWYGESEFWAALGKVILAVGLIFFTFIVMVGGNPKHDVFGFRYWKTPGSFAELYYEADLGRWLGFLQCLIQASFTIAGPDYVSMAAGETENPRKVMPKAFNAVFYRLTSFFMLGALCVGILVPYNDKELINAFKEGKPGAAASPYVVAMTRLGIPALPHLVNALVLTACFSAGNSYVYCASRSLYGMALEGKAPKIFTKCTKKGVPRLLRRACVGVCASVFPPAWQQLSQGSQLVCVIGHGIAAHQFQLHVHIVHLLLQGTQSPRNQPRFPPPQVNPSALCCLVCPGLDLYHGVCGRIHGIFTWLLEHSQFPILVSIYVCEVGWLRG